MDNTRKFSGRAANYSVGRPAYANEFIDMLYREHGFSERTEIADVGCGTGIFTKQLLERGSTVFGVEPNDDMLACAERELGEYKNFRAVNGTAENTALAENSVDFVMVAQAFHWFDGAAFKTECRRIMRKGGKVFLIWNTRVTDAEINLLCCEIYSKYCPDFKGLNGNVKKDDQRIFDFFDGEYEYAEFDNALALDKDKFIKRCLSSSYALKEGHNAYNEYLDALGKLFDEHCRGGVLHIPNRTVAYFGEV